MNEVILQSTIETMIYEIRGKQVMLDSDLAKLYGVETKRINEAVKNNLEKFPERFAFHILESEYNSLKSNFSTSKMRGGSRKGHNAFTEQGIAMLATILKTPVAIETSIKIMDAFVLMRKYIVKNNYKEQINNIESKIIEHDNKILLLQESFEKLEEKQKTNHIFFDGQIYDAYSLLMGILGVAKNEIIIIDNYASKELLDIIKDIKVKIIIISSNINDTLKKKYESQYSNVAFIINNSFHDRFIIIDKEILYHCGSSFKDLGKKCFAINKIEDKEYLIRLLSYLN
jgi:hypothetical protein